MLPGELTGVPLKDAARPGLRLLTEQGRQFEREKFAELVEIFPDSVIPGELHDFEVGEENVFQSDRTARSYPQRPAERLSAGDRIRRCSWLYYGA